MHFIILFCCTFSLLKNAMSLLETWKEWRKCWFSTNRLDFFDQKYRKIASQITLNYFVVGFQRSKGSATHLSQSMVSETGRRNENLVNKVILNSIQ